MKLEMALSAVTGKEEPRFGALLRGGGKAIFDRPLLETPGWLVAPTVGAAIPNWLLVIPRSPVLSFRDWAVSGGETAIDVLAHVRRHLGLSLEEVIWFEHGPSRPNTAVGCGLDHAHLHVLVKPSFTFPAFVERARSSANLRWYEGRADEAFQKLEPLKSYYVAGSGSESVRAFEVEAAGSQFFRRVVASFAPVPAEWDYRQYHHRENVAQTIATFQALESAARREQ